MFFIILNLAHPFMWRIFMQVLNRQVVKSDSGTIKVRTKSSF